VAKGQKIGQTPAMRAQNRTALQAIHLVGRLRRLLVVMLFSGVALAQNNTISFDETSKFPISVFGSVGDVVHARIESNTGPAPDGYLEIFANGGSNIAGVSFHAKPPILSGRMYAEVLTPATVGVAFSNPSAQPVTLTFYFTDSTGTDTAIGTTTLPANGQLARFLYESPFNAPSGFRGTFTFGASSPVGVLAVLGTVNELGQFLMPEVPVTEINETGGSIIPYFAVGTSRLGDIPLTTATDVLMVNTTNQAKTGAFTFLGQGSGTSAAQPVSLTINGQTGTSFRYDIPPRSSRRFVMSEIREALIEGSVRIVPDSGGEAPAALAVINLASSSVIQAIRVTQSQNTVASQHPSSDLRVFVMAGAFGPGHVAPFVTTSQVALANPSGAAVTVNLEMEDPLRMATVVVPANGQVIYPVNNVGGFTYNGILRISSNTPVSAIAFQNSTTTLFTTYTRAPFDATPALPGQPELPHLPRILSYYSNIIILKTSESQASSGLVRFFSQTGEPVAP
jgi:hypothetical protein